jgi:hypothetical protein
LFTLFVVPAMYSLLAQAHQHGEQRVAQPLDQAQAVPAQRG